MEYAYFIVSEYGLSERRDIEKDGKRGIKKKGKKYRKKEYNKGKPKRLFQFFCTNTPILTMTVACEDLKTHL